MNDCKDHHELCYQLDQLGDKLLEGNIPNINKMLQQGIVPIEHIQ